MDNTWNRVFRFFDSHTSWQFLSNENKLESLVPCHDETRGVNKYVNMLRIKCHKMCGMSFDI